MKRNQDHGFIALKVEGNILPPEFLQVSEDTRNTNTNYCYTRRVARGGLNMWIDPIVEEVHKHREEFAAQFNFDLHAIVKALQEMERTSGRKLVSFAPNAMKENSESTKEASQRDTIR